MTRIDYFEVGRTRHEYWESDKLELPEGHRNRRPEYVCYSYWGHRYSHWRHSCNFENADALELPSPRKITDQDKEDLFKAIATHEHEYFTDSDMMDFADKRNLSYREVSHFLAATFAPEQCKGCKNVAFVAYPKMYPCSMCTRTHDIKDMYEKEKKI